MLFARGGRRGARSATQIHDRFHLLTNLSEAVESDVKHVQLQARIAFSVRPPVRRHKQLGRRKMHRDLAREARREQYAAVVELARLGETIKAISKQLRLCEQTVSRWLRAPVFPERRLASYFVGKTFLCGRVAALLAQPGVLLTASQRRYRREFLQLYPSADVLHKLLLRFRALLRWRRPSLLRRWLAVAEHCGFPFTERFAQLLERDFAAVRLSITAPWTNGPIEGQINRLKLLKRQMYGRAGFDLLKARVMPLELEAAA